MNENQNQNQSPQASQLQSDAVEETEFMYEKLIRNIASYDNELANLVLKALNERFASALTHGLSVGENDAERKVIRNAINHMLDNHKSRYEIYKYLIEVLDMPEDTIDEVYSYIQEQRNPKQPKMCDVFKTVDQ